MFGVHVIDIVHVHWRCAHLLECHQCWLSHQNIQAISSVCGRWQSKIAWNLPENPEQDAADRVHKIEKSSIVP